MLTHLLPFNQDDEHGFNFFQPFFESHDSTLKRAGGHSPPVLHFSLNFPPDQLPTKVLLSSSSSSMLFLSLSSHLLLQSLPLPTPRRRVLAAINRTSTNPIVFS